MYAFTEELKKRITASARSLEWGLCHGDMHGNNNAFQQGGSFTHYDLEWTAKGWRAYDLAQVKARKRQSGEQKHNYGMRSWQVIVRYETSPEDEQAIDLFIIARRFWVMGLDVAFIENDMGALDYGDDWLNSFIEEFRETGII